MSDNLCPYCHSVAEVRRLSPPDGRYYLECPECAARGPGCATSAAAEQTWHQPHNELSLLSTVINASPDVILVKDEDCRFLLANEALARLYNTTTDALIGKTDADFNDNREETEFFDQSVRDILARGEADMVEEVATDQTTGITHYFHSLKQPILLQPGNRKALLVIAHDVTELKQRLLDVAARERRYDYAMNAAGEGIWDWNLPEGTITHNTTWGELLGYENVDIHDLEFFTGLIHKDDRDRVLQQVQEALEGNGLYVSEHRLRRADGRFIWALDRGRVVERDAAGAPVRMVGSFSDITSRREAEEKLNEVRSVLEQTNSQLEQMVRERTSELVSLNHQLEKMVRRDPLTGLANRLAADDELTRRFALLEEDGVPFALMLIDIDHFKRVNDTWGHQVGDHALCHIARELSAAVQDQGFIARFGGEEFLLLRPSASAEDAQAWAENLCSAIASTAVPHSDPIWLTISVGLVYVEQSALTVHEAIRRADVYLYQAKHEGRNGVRSALNEARQTSL